jgi:hypothetical protein
MKTSLSAGIMLLSVAGVLIVATGCIGSDYVANRDIVVIRLDQDGMTVWTRSIDTGYDDSANDIAETPDGGLVIAGGRTNERIGIPSPRIVRLSPDGTVLWDRDLGTSSRDLTAVAVTTEGNYAAVSHDGGIWLLGPEGTTRWSRDTGLEQVWSVATTDDGWFVMAGEETGRIPFGSVVVYNPDGTVSSRPPLANESVMTPGCTQTSLPVGPDRTVMVTQCTVPFTIVRQGTVVKLGSDGYISWKRSYGAEGLQSAWSVIENAKADEYLVAGFSEYPEDEVDLTTYLSAVRIDSNGSPLQVSPIDQVQYYRPPLLRSAQGGYDVLYTHTELIDGMFVNKPAEVHIDYDGSVSTPRVIDAGVVTTWTDDGGYIFAAFPADGGISGYRETIYERADRYRLHATRLDRDGTLIWDREIQGVVANQIKKVIQTSDGGYVILAVNDNY